MNSPSSSSPEGQSTHASHVSSGASDSAVNREDLEFLAHQLKLSVVAILIGTAGIAAFLTWHYQQLRREANNRTKAVEQITEEQKKLNAVVDPLREYGRTHPDFAPILRKVGLTPAEAPPASLPPPPR